MAEVGALKRKKVRHSLPHKCTFHFYVTLLSSQPMYPIYSVVTGIILFEYSQVY